MKEDAVISSMFFPEDLYILPGEDPQTDTLIITAGGQTLIFNDLSNAERDFWRNMDERAVTYMLSYSSQTWTLKCYDYSFDAGEYPLVGEWERKTGHDSWKQYPLELEVKETT